MARWCRPVPPTLAAALAGADLAGYARHDAAGTPEELRRSWPAALAKAGLPRPVAILLAEDVADLARCFAAALAAARVRLQLEPVTGDSCRRYHADHMAARLITTYRGAGTEWLAPAVAARVVDGRVPDGVPVERLATGELAMMQGRLWPPGRPPVHRSPPIVGLGRDRLVLAVDVAPAAGEVV